MVEVFRDIEGYKVSNFGNCECKVVKLKNGYLATLDKKKYVHVLVSKAFPEICGEWFDGCDIHHKDENKENNNAENLIILTKKEHRQIHHIGVPRSDETKKKLSIANKGKMCNRTDLSRKIECIETGTIYQSLRELQRITGYRYTWVSKSIKLRKTAYGYHWRFI